MPRAQLSFPSKLLEQTARRSVRMLHLALPEQNLCVYPACLPSCGPQGSNIQDNSCLRQLVFTLCTHKRLLACFVSLWAFGKRKIIHDCHACSYLAPKLIHVHIRKSILVLVVSACWRADTEAAPSVNKYLRRYQTQIQTKLMLKRGF